MESSNLTGTNNLDLDNVAPQLVDSVFIRSLPATGAHEFEIQGWLRSWRPSDRSPGLSQSEKRSLDSLNLDRAAILSLRREQLEDNLVLVGVRRKIARAIAIDVEATKIAEVPRLEAKIARNMAKIAENEVCEPSKSKRYSANFCIAATGSRKRGGHCQIGY